MTARAFVLRTGIQHGDGSIQTGNLLNEAMSGAESTLSAMLGRMAAETGREVTWEDLLKSTEVYDPKINFAQFA